jgi:hypothetical protein
MTTSNFIEEYQVETNHLTKNDLQVLEKLKEAVKLVAEIYAQQLDSKNRPLFYPKDATVSEIESAATKDKEILSPYTIVERDKSGKLIAIPYHIKYQDQLKKIADKLEEAARISTNKEFATALRIQAESLLNGNYDKAQIAWMQIKPYVIDIVIGPFERIDDDLLFVKRAYQAWLGIMNKDLTERAINFQEIVNTARRRLRAPGEKIEFIDKAQIRADDVLIFSGMIAKFKWTGTTLPNDIELLEKYGSESYIFLPSAKELFKSRHIPLFNAIFATHFKQAFSQEDLQRGYLYTVMMHEIARVSIRYRYAINRLKELYPIFNELTLEATAIKICGNLLLKDVISQKEMESILIMFITRIFDYYFEMKDNPTAKPYVLGNAILLNSLVSSGALKVTKEGISWPNYTKMFIAVSNLADEMEKILAEGRYEDTQNYLKNSSSLDIFKQFRASFDKSYINRVK